MKYRVVMSLMCLTFIPPTFAAKVNIACGINAAPWVVNESNSGILIELFKEALVPLGHDVEVFFYPMTRRVHAYKAKKIDAICDVNDIQIEHANLQGYYSEPIYQFENYFYSLKKNNFAFTSIDDIAAYSLLVWQGASITLPSDYLNMTKKNPHYEESFDQKNHIKSLYSERVDVIQMDKQIFEYYRAQVAQDDEVDVNQPIEVFSFLGANPNGVLFHEKSLRDEFVQQITIMKLDGRYQAVFDRYGKAIE